MYLLIDAYNLLHAVIKTKPSERDKDNFIARLIRYGAHKGHKIVLVFDGGSSPIATHERMGGVTIVHVGYKETADDYIKRVLDDARKDMVLISSDNALVKHAKKLGIETVDAATFAQILADKKIENRTGLIAGEKIQRLHTEDRDESLAALMEEESRRLPVKDEDVNVHIKTKHTPSKKEKQQSRIIRKL